MLRFKVDENLPHELIDLIRQAGMDACHVLEQRLGGHADRKVADACRAEMRAVVTLDLDFADMRAYPPDQYHGILVLRLTKQDTDSVLSVFRKLLPMLGAGRVVGRLWIIDESGVRVRGGSD